MAESTHPSFTRNLVLGAVIGAVAGLVIGLIVWAIVETKEGLANVREIAQVPGLSVLVPGAGTLGGVA